MADQFRVLCEELLRELQNAIAVHYGEDGTHHISAADAVITRTDAALAAAADGPAVPEGKEPASVVGEPSDEELAQAARAALETYRYSTELPYFLDLASPEYEPFMLALRAALAAAPTPPAEGEVGELVADELVRQLRTKAATEKANRCHYSAILLTRAADLLAQRHPAPVPVSERLPGAEDCNEDGKCWAWRNFNPDDDDDGEFPFADADTFKPRQRRLTGVPGFR